MVVWYQEGCCIRDELSVPISEGDMSLLYGEGGVMTRVEGAELLLNKVFAPLAYIGSRWCECKGLFSTTALTIDEDRLRLPLLADS